MKIGENPNGWAFTKHEYDLDIIDVYRNLERLTENSSDLKPSFDREAYLGRIKFVIESYCDDNKIDFDFHFSIGNLIIPSTESFYEFFLGFAIISWDVYKLRAFLNAQNKNYSGNGNFANLIEFRVYEIVVKNSPFKEMSERQSILMKWVEEQKLLQEEAENQPSTSGNNVSGELAGELHSSEKTVSAAFSGKTESLKSPKNVTFESIFFDPSRIESLIGILQDNLVISQDGVWKGNTSRKSEILSLIDVLQEKRYIKKLSRTVLARVFCEKFGLQLHDRSLRSVTQTYYDCLEYYNGIIPSLSESRKRSQPDSA